MFLKKYDGSLEASNLKMAERIEKLIGTIETMQESIDLKIRQSQICRSVSNNWNHN